MQNLLHPQKLEVFFLANAYYKIILIIMLDQHDRSLLEIYIIVSFIFVFDT